MAMVDVTLMRLALSEYEHFIFTDNGVLLRESFPKQMYVTMYDDKILEVAPELTDAMREMFPEV